MLLANRLFRPLGLISTTVAFVDKHDKQTEHKQEVRAHGSSHERVGYVLAACHVCHQCQLAAAS